ncbi:MAG TPA: UDP binding domain-containing protein, partial [Caulobacteraceae bacterium]
MGIRTRDVIEAAGTKWNFHKYTPGLVGGHCIGVDPYYLTHKAQEIGHHPEVILAGRRINDSMGGYIAGRVLRLLLDKGINPAGAKALVLGLAFKENCPDLRNTKVADVIAELAEHRVAVDVHDPWVDPHEAMEEYGLSLTSEPKPGAYDLVILAVAHRELVKDGAEGVKAFARPNAVIFDVKAALPKEPGIARL